TVLESQRSLLASQDSLASAQAAISTDVVKLFKALGGGWTKENNQLTDENLVSQAVSATE
ncbi:MAG TPA: TolC family protein, partial [Comamonas denitrificans]|nr:TolC family protein [Comamonas denitrificans]